MLLSIAPHAPAAAAAAADVAQVLVVGAGAAGLTAAYFAAKVGAQVAAQACMCPASNSRALHTRLCAPVAAAGGALALAPHARACSQVTVLERTREAGKKVLMSGGTRW